MRYEDFSERANDIMELATREARRLKNNEVLVEHLFLAMLRDNKYHGLERGRAMAYDLLSRRVSNIQRLRNRISDIATSGYSGDFRYSPEIDRIIEIARDYACKRKEKIVGTEHLLYAVLSHKKRNLTDILGNFKISVKEINKDIDCYGKL